MTYDDRMKRALITRLGSDKVKFMRDWRKKQTGNWRSRGRALGLMLHHTAAAATDSTSPTNPGNQTGANNGVINYIQNHFRVPAANFTLDRDGTVYVHSAYPVWHAGVGSFKGKAPWDQLQIPVNEGNHYLLGVEIVSKGLKKDFTLAQKKSLALLIDACSDIAHENTWKPLWLKNRPQHRDWTSRKVDLRYTNDEVKSWIEAYSAKA